MTVQPRDVALEMQRSELARHSKTSVGPPSSEIACSTCTFLNAVGSVSCAMCGGSLKAVPVKAPIDDIALEMQRLQQEAALEQMKH